MKSGIWSPRKPNSMLLEFSPVVHDQVLVLGMMLQRRGCVLSLSLWGGSPPKTGAVLAASPPSASRYTDVRDNVPRPIWTHSKVTDSKKKKIPQGQPGHDKFYVSGFPDLLPERMQPVYWPNPEVPIDEAMIPFKGQLSLFQYMMSMPIKRGITLFILAD